MGINAGRVVVGTNNPEPAPVESMEVKPVIIKAIKAAPVEGTALIVNGKQKPISKKSAYLLDMLTLDDE
jgi:hypothetical protein